MHMADALISPVVGGVLWTAAATTCGYSLKRIRTETKDETREKQNFIPLIGVAAAFVFAAQMINFTIPGTGSSGHIGGGAPYGGSRPFHTWILSGNTGLSYGKGNRWRS